MSYKTGERVELSLGIDGVSTKALEYGEVEVIVSNSGTDRHGERILAEGIDLSQIKRNPVLLWGHDYMGLPIGQIKRIWKSAGNVMAKIKLDYDIYDFADKVYKMIQRGTINAVSIGGIIKEMGDDGLTIKKLEMVELSVVPVGAHPDALVTAKALGVNKDEVEKSYQQFLQKSLSDKFTSVEPDEIENIIKAMKTTIAALEGKHKELSKENADEKQVVKVVLSSIKKDAVELDRHSENLIKTLKVKMKGNNQNE